MASTQTTRTVTVSAYRTRQGERPVAIGAHAKATISNALLHYGTQPGAGTFKRPRIVELVRRIQDEATMSLAPADASLIESALASYGQNPIRRQNAVAVASALRAAM